MVFKPKIVFFELKMRKFRFLTEKRAWKIEN
jgi:hypothetical protein